MLKVLSTAAAAAISISCLSIGVARADMEHRMMERHMEHRMMQRHMEHRMMRHEMHRRMVMHHMMHHDM